MKKYTACLLAAAGLTTLASYSLAATRPAKPPAPPKQECYTAEQFAERVQKEDLVPVTLGATDGDKVYAVLANLKTATGVIVAIDKKAKQACVIADLTKIMLRGKAE
jgi:hypothetical protein